MNYITTALLLVASFGLFYTTSADISTAPVQLMEKFKISNDLPEIPVVLENKVLKSNIYHDNGDNGDDGGDYDYHDEKLPELDQELEEVMSETRAKECNIEIRSGLNAPQPVFLQTNKPAFYPYSDTGYINVRRGKTLQMFCSDKFIFFDKTLIKATCVGGTIFKVGGTKYNFSDFACNSWPRFVAKKTGATCNGGILIQVGFNISSSRFVEQMQICFNEEEEVTRYVYHTLQAGSNYYSNNVDRISFQTAGFFNTKNVNKLYEHETHQKIIITQLGGVGNEYFNKSKNMYLSRGHMAAKADFVYGTQQRATFLYINVAPQWQVFNSGNWARMESSVRSWVTKNKINVECYTGVFGVTTLPNKEGYDTPLYLSRDANNNGLIPVPKLYFRVIIQPATKKGIVFVGVNNPHLTLEQIERDYVICDDVSSQVKYISWKKSDIIAGYSYACEVSDFLKKVKTLPPLSAPGGLLI